MKKAIIIVVVILIAMWLLAWTPLFEYLPQIIQSFMFAYGGVLTIVLPILAGIVVVWVVTGRANKSNSVTR